jgi:predicted AlkP superfamily pyrophosphatase or phosphodiesterase
MLTCNGMKPVLPLFIFIDACGWEIVKNDPFLTSLAPNRKKLESVFGYSSACVPSILSGRWPAEHRNWSYFVYDPEHSPFRQLRSFSWLPRRITGRRIFRRWLSKLVKRQLNFRGYFDLYNIPFRYISLFDFSEKRSPLRPGGMNRGENIFDQLVRQGVPYHVSRPEQSEEANLQTALDDIQSERIDFAFIYWPGLDGLLHMAGNDSPAVPEKLRSYEKWIAHLTKAAQSHYSEVRLYVFSDHGMANCDESIDLRREIDALGLVMAKDYAVVYDSTMARFWFFNDRARELICHRLEQIPEGRIVPGAELKHLGTFFPDHHFGELIFLLREGVLIVPSDMGKTRLRGMHGYHPSEKHSYAMLCTNQPEITAEVRAIPDIYRLMLREAQLATSRRGPASETPASGLKQGQTAQILAECS